MFSRVAVVGAGTMGQGIAQLVVRSGRTVYLYDSHADALAAAVEAIGRRLGERPDGLHLCTQIEECADVDLAIEAVPERLDLKQRLFRQLDGTLAPACVLASNTSGLDIDALAAVTGRAPRVIGLHFFNPPPKMPLVEVVAGAATDSAVVDEVIAFTESLGKTPVRVANRPGFVVNRLLFAMIAEAARLVDEGDVPPADIDRAMTLGAQHPIGPLALADFIGLDVVVDILDSLVEGLGLRYEVAACLRERVASGDLGRKTGRGFFAYV